MKDVKTQTQIFKEVGDKLHEAGMKGWFIVTNYADYCIQVGLRQSDIKGFTEIRKHYEADVAKLNNNERDGLYAITSIWTDAYLYGEQPSGCCFIKLPKSPEYDLLRYRISSIQTQIKRAGYQVDGIMLRDHFYYEENGTTHHCPAILFGLKNEELDKWRDEQYQSHLYESEIECEDERCREIGYAEYQFCH